jgi:hypothetical protein
MIAVRAGGVFGVAAVAAEMAELPALSASDLLSCQTF